jgi:[acyl-carrier-protein] S-malonyltransferase
VWWNVRRSAIASADAPRERNDDTVTTAVLFPGQGSQYAGMADPWEQHAAGRAVLEEASELTDRDFAAACRDDELLATTEFAQPALLVCDVAAYRVLESEGVAVSGAAGHSLGEYAALVASGALSFAEALGLVVERGSAMQAAADERPGTMTALLGVGAVDGAAIADDVRGNGVLAVANENGPKQVVLAGDVPAIERAEALASERKIRAVRLNVAGAFHSPLMASAVERMRAVLRAVTFQDPVFPVVSNVTGRPVRDGEAFRDLLARHVVSPVRWEASMTALADVGADTFVEAGPGEVLSKLVKRAVPGGYAVAVGGPDAAVAVAAQVARGGV